jgi:dCMP deaminase
MLSYKDFDNYQPPHWNEWFMKMVFLVAQKSKDTKTKIGAVIVNKDNRLLSVGYNGIPVGVDDFKKDRFERPLKYSFFAHAEANCCFSAARLGISLKDSILYTNGVPCSNCTQAIIQSGIKKIYVHKPWQDAGKILHQGSSSIYTDDTISRQMLGEAAIPIECVTDFLDVQAFLNGKTFKV